MIQAHGGRIWVESEVGAGSRFHVALPLPGLSHS
jgi:signal transduction histidine kinase